MKEICNLYQFDYSIAFVNLTFQIIQFISIYAFPIDLEFRDEYIIWTICNQQV